MPIQHFDQVHIHYELTGDPELPVLALSNSLGANLHMWQPQLPELAAHFRLLRYDTRGHGASSAPAGPCTMALLGGDVLRLLDSLGIERAHFCGISMGGLIGQWLAVHAPHRLSKLVLANTAAKIGTPDGWNARIRAVEAEGLGPLIPATLERWFTAGFRGSHPDAIRGIEAMLKATGAQGYAACCAAIRDAGFGDALPSIHLPVLAIAGAHDPVTPPADAQFLADAIPGAKYVELPAAHLSNIEAAGAFNRALLDFLRSPSLNSGV